MARARPGGVGACEGTESARRARCLKVFKPVDARARRDRRKGVRRGVAPHAVPTAHGSPRVQYAIFVDCGQYRNSINRVLLLTDSGLRRDVERGVCPLHPRPCVSRRL